MQHFKTFVRLPSPAALHVLRALEEALGCVELPRATTISVVHSVQRIARRLFSAAQCPAPAAPSAPLAALRQHLQPDPGLPGRWLHALFGQLLQAHGADHSSIAGALLPLIHLSPEAFREYQRRTAAAVCAEHRPAVERALAALTAGVAGTLDRENCTRFATQLSAFQHALSELL